MKVAKKRATSKMEEAEAKAEQMAANFSQKIKNTQWKMEPGLQITPSPPHRMILHKLIYVFRLFPNLLV